MSLTKAQKELLETMKDKGYYIRHWMHGTSYSLVNDEGEKIKSIRYDWMNCLGEFMIKTYRTGYQTYEYRINPDAQFTDTWLQAERLRKHNETKAIEDAKQAEKERLNKIASDYFNNGNPGPYQVSFDGQWPFGGSILFNGEVIAQISAVHYSTSDKTFDDMMQRSENAPHFEAIKAMLQAANKSV